jgi:hypothetical protein
METPLRIIIPLLATPTIAVVSMAFPALVKPALEGTFLSSLIPMSQSNVLIAD